MYLTVDLLIDICTTVTGLNNITLRKVNVKLCACDKMHTD